MRRSSRRLLLLLVCGVAVFAAFSVYTDVRDVGAELGGFGWWALCAALALALVNYGIRYLRWELYLRSRALAVPRKLSLLTFLSGFAMSVTPAKVGELMKSYLLREGCGIPISRSAPIVVAERVTDLTALLLLGALGTALHGVGERVVLAGVILLLAGLAALASPRFARLAIAAATAPRPLRRFRERLEEFYRGLADLVRPGPLAWGTGLGVVAWLAECVGFALIVAAFPGAEVSVELAILIYATATVAGALSFLPAGLLVTEAGMTLLLVQMAPGVSEATAVAATILTRLATLWFAVLLGVVALAWLRRTVRAVQAAEGG